MNGVTFDDLVAGLFVCSLAVLGVAIAAGVITFLMGLIAGGPGLLGPRKRRGGRSK